MSNVYESLKTAGISFLEYGSTAIDAYAGLRPSPVRFILVEGSVIDLAKALENLEYPGLPYCDASAADRSGEAADFRFLCAESMRAAKTGVSPYMNFKRDAFTGVFYDPEGVYSGLRSGRIQLPPDGGGNSLFEAAILASRFPMTPEELNREYQIPELVTPLWQKDLLSLALTGPYPAQSFAILESSGFVSRFWPDIAALKGVDHAKEFHPEGGGWNHTMETFAHRKTYDLALSLALLLHDTGKARSKSREGNKFNRHAEIGAAISREFLASLGFGPKIIDDVFFLIRWHMMPAALPKLSLRTVAETLRDSRFPQLLELFRCDEFSSFKGPDTYYSACAAYKSKIKDLKAAGF